MIVLGAGSIVLNGCKENNTSPTPSSKSCYLTSYNGANGNYTYELDADNKVIKASVDTTEITFTYTGAQLTSAFDGEVLSNFHYGGNTEIPDSIFLTYQGTPLGHLAISESNGDITGVLFNVYDQTQQLIPVSRYTYTYDNMHNVSMIKVEQLNFSTGQLVELGRFENITHDDKINPFERSLAYFYIHYEEPFAVGVNNITSATITSQGATYNYDATFTYNDDDYPTAVDQDVAGAVTTASFGYTCE